MKKVVLFVHGLGGGEGTFGKFEKLIKDDPDLNYSTSIFLYPTSVTNMIPMSKFARVQTLSDALKTFINHTLREFDEIVLVAHSLGGLLVRQYLLTEWNSRRETKVKKIIFYAVPQDGAGLAKVSSYISWRHQHLKQLTRASEFLENLNNSWATSKIESEYEMKIVIAAGDEVVSENSSRANFRHLEIEVLADKGHSSIVKPVNEKDLSFVILKNFLRSVKTISNSKPIGAIDFKHWAKRDDNYPFFGDKKRQDIITNLSQNGFAVGSVTRIIGLSGLGKTRLLLEVFKAMPLEVQRSTVYIDVAVETNNLLARVTDWVTGGMIGTLVVDNCSVLIHDSLARTLGQPGSNVALITIDTDLKKSGDCRLIELGRLDDDMIKAMLTHNYGQTLPDVDRIVSFAQGFPQMAVLIAKARINLDPNVGKLNDDLMAHKLLWGDGEENTLDKKILLGCALFDRFGLDDEANSEYKYIANNIVEVNESDFYECVGRFTQRGLIDRRGRYGQLVPKPLAIRLASIWWNLSQREAQDSLISSMPNSLVDSFCSQIEKLDFLPDVKNFTANLCGPQGFFGQAEVILSIRGSRLFRAFVAVNPEATSDALYRVISSLDDSQRFNITGDVRRNLVWALEMLCFHNNIFNESGWILYLLAKAENETWSNNATGMFAQLFRAQLSGTQAPPAFRIKLIERAMSESNVESDLVVLAGVKEMINLHGGTRTVGAEYQGSRPPLEEWRAEIWQEIFDIWDTAIDILLDMMTRGVSQKEKALEILGGSIRGLIGRGRLNSVDRAIRAVVDLHGKYWPSALDSLKTTKQHDLDELPEGATKAVETWLKLLNPQDSGIAEKILILIIDPPWEHEEDGRGDFIDVAAKNAKVFAEELLKCTDILYPYIPVLLTGAPKQAYQFGLTLATSADAKTLIRKVLLKISKLENPNINFAMGLLDGVNKISTGLWNRYIHKIGMSRSLQKYYPDFVRTGDISICHLETIIHLIAVRDVEVFRASSLAYGGITSKIPADSMSEFCVQLARISSEATWVALDILFMYARQDAEKLKACRTALCQLTLRVSLGKKNGSGRFGLTAWKDLVKRFLDSEDEMYAIGFSELVLTSIGEGFEHQDLLRYIKPLLAKMFEKHARHVWPLFSSAIANSTGMDRYWLHALFEKENHISGKQVSLFSRVNISDVIAWCFTNIEEFPRFVASCIDVYYGTNITPLALALLQNFGDNPKVGSALAANMATRSWSGSLVPYLEADKAALVPLLSSHDAKVRAWAALVIGHLDAEIASEQTRDDEQGFGIF